MLPPTPSAFASLWRPTLPTASRGEGECAAFGSIHHPSPIHFLLIQPKLRFPATRLRPGYEMRGTARRQTQASPDIAARLAERSRLSAHRRRRSDGALPSQACVPANPGPRFPRHWRRGQASSLRPGRIAGGAEPRGHPGAGSTLEPARRAPHPAPPCERLRKTPLVERDNLNIILFCEAGQSRICDYSPIICRLRDPAFAPFARFGGEFVARMERSGMRGTWPKRRADPDFAPLHPGYRPRDLRPAARLLVDAP